MKKYSFLGKYLRFGASITHQIWHLWSQNGECAKVSYCESVGQSSLVKRLATRPELNLMCIKVTRYAELKERRMVSHNESEGFFFSPEI